MEVAVHLLFQATQRGYATYSVNESCGKGDESCGRGDESGGFGIVYKDLVS
jgi:hypothetical protein